MIATEHNRANGANHIPTAENLPSVRGLIETSFLDWPGKVCAVLFLGGCNFRCPFCHNHPLVLDPGSVPALPLAECLTRLAPFRDWLSGICVTGGEPTLDEEKLVSLLKHLKREHWPVKLDTNGSRPDILSSVIRMGLADMIAMDVKAPLNEEAYSRCAGVSVSIAAIRQSVGLIKESGLPHQFRMTVLPLFHNEADVKQWASELRGENTLLTLQNFNPQSTLNPSLEKHPGFTPDEFASLQRLVANTVRHDHQSQ